MMNTKDLLNRLTEKKNQNQPLNLDEILCDANNIKENIKALIEGTLNDELILECVNYCNQKKLLEINKNEIKSIFKIGGNRAEKISNFLNTYFFNSNNENEEINKLILIYKEKKFDEFIEIFESNESYYSLSLTLVQYYIFSLYSVEDKENEGISAGEKYLDRYPNDEIIHLYLGHLYDFENNLKKALEHYKQSNDVKYINKIKDKINKSNVVQEPLLHLHFFKSSRGLLFCKFCGKEKQYAPNSCNDSIKKHNFILMKDKYNEWFPTCTKCGCKAEYAHNSCD